MLTSTPNTHSMPTKELCQHLASLDISEVSIPDQPVCEACIKLGDTWVHLRQCVECGHVGCCDSSKNLHASKHHAQTDHPVIVSAEAGEEWAWCYPDEIYYSR